jgi:hypothetical protein
MTSTPALIIAASNLVNSQGLAPNVATTTLCNTITSSALVAAFANVQPGTTNGNVLQSNSLSVSTLNLPAFVANANTTVANITAQTSKVYPDLITFTSLLLSAESFVLYSSQAHAAVSSITGSSFDTLGIDVSSHQSAVTNGIASAFGGAATAAADIKTNITKIASALKNFGTLYDPTQLGKLGDPATFVSHVVKMGYDFTPPDGWETMDAKELKYYLDSITGPVFTRIMSLSGFTPPAGSSITSLGDLLDLSKVFPADALALIPGNNFAGLANMFVNLGGKFKSLDDVSSMLSSIEVPSLSFLNSYTSPVPAADATKLTSKIGSGSGDNNNPTILDILGTVAGVHLTDLTTVSTALTTVSSTTAAQTLLSSLTSLASACAGGNSSTITSAFATATSAATAFKSDATVVAQSAANNAITNIASHIVTENSNLTAANINTQAAASSGVAGLLALVNNLHDYGVDRNNLKFNELFAGMVQQNVGGDAILASLAEGKNIDIQSKFSVPIGTKIA